MKSKLLLPRLQTTYRLRKSEETHVLQLDHLLLSDTIVTIIQHIFPQEEHDPDFYSRDTERAATFFTPSETGTYPDEAINHLGYPTQHP